MRPLFFLFVLKNETPKIFLAMSQCFKMPHVHPNHLAEKICSSYFPGPSTVNSEKFEHQGRRMMIITAKYWLNKTFRNFQGRFNHNFAFFLIPGQILEIEGKKFHWRPPRGTRMVLFIMDLTICPPMTLEGRIFCRTLYVGNCRFFVLRAALNLSET